MKTHRILFVSFAFSLSCQLLFANQPPGQVVGWGENIAGEATGVPSYPFSNGVVIITDNPCSTGTVTVAGSILTNITQIVAGGICSLALKTDGTVVGWGAGMVRNSNTEPPHPYLTNGPIIIGGHLLSNVVSVAVGGDFCLGLKRDGTVVAWGKQQQAKAVSSVPVVSDNEQTKLLKKKSASFIDPETGLPVDKNVTSGPRYAMKPARDALGNSFNIKLKSDGTVLTRVENHEPAPLGKIVAIAAHEFTALALKSDGTVVGWNSESSLPTSGQLYVIEGLSNIVAVATGGEGNVQRRAALKRDGTVVTWGPQTVYGDATPPDNLSNVIAVAVGYNHSLALKKDGTVVGWGFNEGGQATGVAMESKPQVTNGLVRIGGQVLSNVTAIAAYDRYSLALKNDGAVVAWGRYCPSVPAGLSNIVAIAAGRSYCLAITTNSSTAIKK